MAMSIDRNKAAEYFNSQLDGTGYKIICKVDHLYDPFMNKYYLFYLGDEIFSDEDWHAVLEYQRKHIKLINLIMPEDEDE